MEQKAIWEVLQENLDPRIFLFYILLWKSYEDESSQESLSCTMTLLTSLLVVDKLALERILESLRTECDSDGVALAEFWDVYSAEIPKEIVEQASYRDVIRDLFGKFGD